MALTEDRIREALAAVTDPSQNRNVIELGLVTSIKISDSNVGIIMEVPAHRGPALEPIRKRVEEAVLGKKREEKIRKKEKKRKNTKKKN
jgi:ATP-binding protein involved in chromosome partitioning